MISMHHNNKCLVGQSDRIINLKDKQGETIGRKAWRFEVNMHIIKDIKRLYKKYNNRRLNGRERADANKNKLKQTTKRWKRRNLYLACDILIKFPFPKLFHNCCNICPSLIWIIIIFKKIYRFSIIFLFNLK